MRKQLLLKHVQVFSKLTSCLLSKFLLNEVSRKKESQWYSQETVNSKF